MADLVFIFVIIALFGLASALVAGCNHIIGPDDPAESAFGPVVAAPEEVAA